MTTHRFPCPLCHEQSGQPLEEINQGEVDRSEIEHLPEGVSGVTVVQCTNPLCHHEWQTVTHRQILRSLSLWNAPAPKMV